MKNIKVRELRPSDMEKIGLLLRTREELDGEGAEKRKLLFEWCAFNNPFADNKPTYFIAEDSNKIIAHLGRMPTEFIVNGRRRKGYFIHDLFVHPEYRKKGLGFFLSMSLYQAIEDKSESFCCLVWTSELNLEFQRKRGYYEMWAPKYVKVFNPIQKLENSMKQKSLAKALTPIFRRILRLIDFILVRSIPSNTEVSKIDRFDSRFDKLNERLLHKAGICSFKGSSYLNWKFVDRPFNKTTVWAAEKNGEILGFAVVALSPKKEYPEGTIVDITVDPDDTSTLSALLRAIIDHFRRESVYSIECCLTDKRLVKVFKRFLFFKALGKEPVMLANLKKCQEKDYLINMNNWHLTYGESDEFMLRP